MPVLLRRESATWSTDWPLVVGAFARTNAEIETLRESVRSELRHSVEERWRLKGRIAALKIELGYLEKILEIERDPGRRPGTP